MNVRQVKNKQDWKNLKKLYKTAFPRNERKPLFLIKRMKKKGCADIWVLENNDEFVGLAMTMQTKDTVLLDYFAIETDKRNCGYGKQSLEILQDIYKSYRFILEIERPDIESENQRDRKRRKDFYLSNGMQELDVKIKLFGVEMELLGKNCELSFSEYKNLYIQCLGKKIAANVKQGQM